MSIFDNPKIFVGEYTLNWFDSLMIDAGINDSDSIQLINYYTSYARAYHNLHHIASMWKIHKNLCMQETKSFKHGFEKNLANAVAYHDVIYNSKANTNEIDSIQYYEHNCTIAKRKPEYWVIKAIATTQNHFDRRPISNLDDELIEWFIGLDLCSLATPWEMFCANGWLLRAEYHHLSTETWRIGRDNFFKKALEKRPIFQHPVFERCFEDRAIDNIERALKEGV